MINVAYHSVTHGHARSTKGGHQHLRGGTSKIGNLVVDRVVTASTVPHQTVLSIHQGQSVPTSGHTSTPRRLGYKTRTKPAPVTVRPVFSTATQKHSSFSFCALSLRAMATTTLTTNDNTTNAKADAEKYARIVNIIVRRCCTRPILPAHVAMLSAKHDRLQAKRR
jgi:hypothetical protein